MTICSLVLLALGIGLYARRGKLHQRDGLSELIESRHLFGADGTPAERDVLLTLLFYEDRYPAFSAILQKIVPLFPLSHFASTQEFGQALDQLTRLTQGSAGYGVSMRVKECGALATMTRVILDDPRVQATCGADLQPLVDELISQIREASVAGEGLQVG